MFVIRKQRVIDEALLLKDGKRRLRVRVHAGPEDLVRGYDAAWSRLVAAEAAVKTAPTAEAMEAYGEAVTGFFSVLFGEEQTMSILNFFDGKYLDMLVAMFRFIRQRIAPRLSRVSLAEMAQARHRRK